LLKVYSLILKQGILAQTLRNAEDSSHRMYARWQYRQNSLYFSLLAGNSPGDGFRLTASATTQSFRTKVLRVDSR